MFESLSTILPTAKPAEKNNPAKPITVINSSTVIADPSFLQILRRVSRNLMIHVDYIVRKSKMKS